MKGSPQRKLGGRDHSQRIQPAQYGRV